MFTPTSEYRVKLATVPAYYFTGPSPAAAIQHARYYIGDLSAPVECIDTLVVAEGPTQNLAGAGVLIWVPCEVP